MNKLRRFAAFNKFSTRALILVASIFWGGAGVFAQEIETTFEVSLDAPARVSVEGRFLKLSDASKNWSFLRNYADASGLERRIENLRLFDAGGKRLEIKKIADGEFSTVENAVSWRYDVKTELPNAGAAAHVSWLAADRGLLMPGDLLPRLGDGATRARIKFELPAGWTLVGGEPRNAANEFVSENAEKSVFLIGKNWREKTERIGALTVNFATAGEWQFSDAESLEMAGEILREQAKIFGGFPAKRVQIFLTSFPQDANADDWRAETRGANLILISGAIPFKSTAAQRLHEQLRHELFHLWLPNAVNLRGGYDWFYEGFTVYQALKTGVMLNRIRFRDLLDTLGQAFDLAKAGTPGVSLVQASNERWRGAGNLIYSKGMLVAFLCDAELLRASGGKRSLTDVFRELYSRHRFPNEGGEANAAVLKILNERAELRPLVKNYVIGGEPINWTENLAALGVETESAGGRTRLKISGEPKGRRRDLLNELGYNQWRKLAPKRK